jgi:phosphoribosylformimino-5-aminoimidazole carboxamide ribotide isomerase
MTEARPFMLLPAIDLRGGRVVRLRQGDFDQETAYGDDPVAVARDFADAGARWLHVVDLDAARTGTPGNRAAVAAIVAAVGDRVHVEVAGGLRDAERVAETLSAGAGRVVIGTAALRDPAFAGQLVSIHGPERIAAAIDVRAGLAVGQGWAGEASGVEVAEAIKRLADAGVVTFEVTAIDRDGLLGGPDLRLYERLIGLGAGAVIASGGVATLQDLRRLRAAGCAGAIIGRALYEARFNLVDALALAARPD